MHKYLFNEGFFSLFILEQVVEFGSLFILFVIYLFLIKIEIFGLIFNFKIKFFKWNFNDDLMVKFLLNSYYKNLVVFQN